MGEWVEPTSANRGISFWPLIVFSNSILRSVSDEHKNRSLSSEHFMSNVLKRSGASEFS